MSCSQASPARSRSPTMRWPRPERVLSGPSALAGAAAAFGLIATLSAWAANAPSSATVTIDNFTFGPDNVTIAAGGQITWVNRDDIPHVVAGADGEFTSPPLDTDDAFTETFARPGTYAYFCVLHPHMTGT